MKKKIVSISLLVNLFLLQFFAFGQGEDIRFRKLQAYENFPSQSIETIIQDSQGFMWFGAFDQLIRYDGYKYKTYAYRSNDSTSLGSRNVKVLYNDSQKRMWVGGSDGLSIYNKNCDCFDVFFQSEFVNNTIAGIIEDSSHIFWVATERGLFEYDSLSNIFKRSITSEPLLSINYIGNMLYLGTEFSGVKIVDTKTRKIVKSINPETYNNYNSINIAVFDLKGDENGNVWFSTYGAGLYFYNIHNQELKNHSEFILKEGVKNVFFTILYQNKNRILIGTLNDGLIVYDSEKNTYYQYLRTEKSDYAIQSNTIRYIYADKNNSIWLGTHLGGVCYYNENDLSIHYYYADGKGKNSLSLNVVSGFSEDDDGNIWITIDGGGIDIFKRDFGVTETITRHDGLMSVSLTDIVRDSKDNMWITPWHGALTKINIPTRKPEIVFYDKERSDELYSINDFKGLYKDTSGRIWVFPLFKSVRIYNERNNSVSTIDNKGAYPDTIFRMRMLMDAIQDKDGNIWLYGFDGMGRLGRNNVFTTYFNTPSRINSLVDNSINNMFVDSRNNVWVCTNGGLDKYDPTTDSFIHLSQDYSFPTNVYGMLEDDNGYIWFTSSSGLGRYHPDTLMIKYFEKNIGIANEEFISRSCFKARNGDMFFGSTNGFIFFNPSQIKLYEKLPEVNITEFLLFNEINKYTDSISPLHKSITVTDTIVLEHNLNIIGFRFSSTNYVASFNNTYMYRLVGFSDKWTYSGTKNEATYTNLDPGKYLFQVKSANNEGVWGDAVKEIVLIVLPPWWKTWWFKIALIIIVLAIFIFILYYREQSIREVNKILEEKVKSRTAELFQLTETLEKQKNEIVIQNKLLIVQKEEIVEKNKHLIEKSEEIEAQDEQLKHKNEELENLNKTKDKFFSIIAHDLKNPMGAVIGFADLLTESFDTYPEEKKKQFIKIISNSTKNLLALLENLLHWSRSQSGVIMYTPRMLHVNGVVESNIILLKDHARKKGISIIKNIEIGLTVYADENMLSTILRNLISNAIKYTYANGIITIGAKIEGDDIVISIKDTGSGMTPAQLDMLFKIEKTKSTPGTEKETGTGLGLILCKEFIDKHSGSIWVESEVDKGSTFFIRLKSL